VVTVSKSDAEAAGYRPPQWDRRARAGTLRRGDFVHAVGCRSGQPIERCFEGQAGRDRTSTADGGDLIDFQSSVVAPGNSGGPLFNARWEITGMVYLRQAFSRARALSIDFVLDEVEDWLDRSGTSATDARIALRPPAVPRGGYNASVGATWIDHVSTTAIVGANGDDLSAFLENRLPSGRLTYRVRRAGSRVTWHLGAMRLAPANLAVAAGLIGAGWSLPLGRLVIRPFAEVGVGRVEARVLAAEYTVMSGDGEVVVPIWRGEEQTSFGVGGGLGVGWMVGRGIILEATIATWRYEAPEGAPEFPGLSVGAGLRWGR
jgi:hypothetical protein